MTTAAQVNRWLRPVLQQRSDLIVRKRVLVVRPVRHVLRWIYFNGASWDKNHPKPYWYIDFLPSPPFWRGRPWFDEIWVGYTSDIDFETSLNASVLQTLTRRLDQVPSIEALLDKTQGSTGFGDLAGLTRLDSLVAYHGPVLAAAGRMAEAAKVIDDWVGRTEVAYLNELAEGRRLLAKRPNSRLGQVTSRLATEYLDLLGELKALAALCQSRDRAAIGAQLRQWEAHNVNRLGLVDLWEPSPYPVELGCGDQA